MKTIITHSKAQFSKLNRISKETYNLKKDIQEPSTILIPEDYTFMFSLKNMTVQQKEQVKKHVLSYMDILSEK
ncbi:hypothetical protein [Chengkuizengella marina]|nr:hypothetical protein [Chengkuizengella marina]